MIRDPSEGDRLRSGGREFTTMERMLSFEVRIRTNTPYSTPDPKSRAAQESGSATSSPRAGVAYMMDSTVHVVREYSLFGRFDVHVTPSGPTGSYAHNALLAWTASGLPRLVMYVMLCETGVAFARGAPSSASAFAVAVTTLLLVATANSVFWIVPGLARGLAANPAALLTDSKQPT
jgi:hypothetical protein